MTRKKEKVWRGIRLVLLVSAVLLVLADGGSWESYLSRPLVCSCSSALQGLRSAGSKRNSIAYLLEESAATPGRGTLFFCTFLRFHCIIRKVICSVYRHMKPYIHCRL